MPDYVSNVVTVNVPADPAGGGGGGGLAITATWNEGTDHIDVAYTNSVASPYLSYWLEVREAGTSDAWQTVANGGNLGASGTLYIPLGAVVQRLHAVEVRLRGSYSDG